MGYSNVLISGMAPFNLKSRLHPGSNAKILAHLMQWFQPGDAHCANTGVIYDSSDLITISNQIKLAQAVGIDGFLVDWYGPSSVNSFGDQALLNLLQVAEIVGGFEVGVCIDKGAVKALVNPSMSYQQAFGECYGYIKNNYAPYAAFFSDFVMEFGCGQAAVAAGQAIDFSNYADVIHDSSKYGRFFSWAGLPSGWPIVQADYGNPECVMGSVCFGFNDGAPENLNNSVWGGPVRLMNRCHQGYNWNSCWDCIPKSMEYVQLVTWNDYEEGTAAEGIFSAMTGMEV